MARDGNGTYSKIFTAVAGTTIEAADYNGQVDDVATALTASIAKDGQTVPTANLPMGSYKHTGVGNASAATHYAAAGQVQNSSLIWGGTAGGTSTALTISVTPGITAYAAGQRFAFITASSQDGTATTINVNSVGAKTISNPIWASGDVVEVVYDGTKFFAVSPTTSDTVVIPSGTVMLFVQAAAPTGWTQYTLINDVVPLISSTAGFVAGGSWYISGLSVESAPHFHAFTSGAASATTPVGIDGPTLPIPIQEHTHSGNTGTESANHTHGGNGTWRPAYVTVIICIKD